MDRTLRRLGPRHLVAAAVAAVTVATGCTDAVVSRNEFMEQADAKCAEARKALLQLPRDTDPASFWSIYADAAHEIANLAKQHDHTDLAALFEEARDATKLRDSPTPREAEKIQNVAMKIRAAGFHDCGW